jgi:Cu2+-exporting ATPase
MSHDASLTPFVRDEEGLYRLGLLVEGAHCGACVARIERLMRADPAVKEARFNLTLKRLALAWDGDVAAVDRLAGCLRRAGFEVAPYATDNLAAEEDRTGKELLRCLGVAGFAAANTMMLAIAVWSGQVQDMGPAQAWLLQWLTGLVGVGAVAYAGRPFFRSAIGALRARRTNIDVPIALALVLTTVISLQELLRGGRDVYFDSAAALLLVLLAGRVLDNQVRRGARRALSRLLSLQSASVTVLDAQGQATARRAEDVEPGMRVLVRPGERIPVDGVVTRGQSDIDAAIVTGESTPVVAVPGGALLAGSGNRTGLLVLRATRPVAQSHLAEVARLVTAAEAQRDRYRMLADRIAAVWTPVLHGLAVVTLLGWVLAASGLAAALLHAVTVLIIACPCAIGLAVPATQVAATGALLRRGVLMRSGDTLERLSEADLVVFDKTGTLTTGALAVVAAPEDAATRRLAASLAAASLHPHARAVAALEPAAVPLADVIEQPGQGVASADGQLRLGSRRFAGPPGEDTVPTLWLAQGDAPPIAFLLSEVIRPDAAAAVAALRERGLHPILLSGDVPGAVAPVAAALGIAAAEGGLRPAEKLARLQALREAGHRVLMVGDGLNDAPALAAAHVSASFTHGAAASQAAADIVLPGGRLLALVDAVDAARRSMTIVRQNMALAVLYNVALVPLAMAGLVTPLIAALAMSASSTTVTLNAMRARRLPGGA